MEGLGQHLLGGIAFAGSEHASQQTTSWSFCVGHTPSSRLLCDVRHIRAYVNRYATMAMGKAPLQLSCCCICGSMCGWWAEGWAEGVDLDKGFRTTEATKAGSFTSPVWASSSWGARDVFCGGG